MSQVVVGQLRVNLAMNTASFVGDAGKAAQTAKRSAKEIQDSFNHIDLHEAKGGFMLFEDAIGVRLPRHVNSFLATLPGLGSALSLAFAPLAVVVLIQKLSEAWEHVSKINEKINEASNAYEDAAQATSRHADAIELDNAKLRDQIAVLNGGLPKNGLKIALEEARGKAEQLTDQIIKAIAEEKKLLNAQSVGFWQSLLGDTRTSDITEFITKGKEAIAELERQKGLALTAHEDDVVKSLQKEIDLKNVSLQREIEDRKRLEDAARVEKIQRDLAVDERLAAAHVRSGRMTGPEAEAKAHAENLEFAKKVNEATATRVRLYDIALLELKSEAREQKDLLENSRLHLGVVEKQAKIASVIDLAGNAHKKSVIGKTDSGAQSAEETAALARAHLYDVEIMAKLNEEANKHTEGWRQINALAEQESLYLQEHLIKLQGESGVISKLEADRRIAALYAQSEAAEVAKQNELLTKQAALVQHLAALTKSGTVGADTDKAAYNKALSDYQKFLLQKEQLKAASNRKQFKAEEDAAARTWAIQRQSIDNITNALNTGVESWISGQNTFGQAFAQTWMGMAQTAVMSIMKMGEQELIGLALHKSVANDKKLTDAKSAFHGAYAATSDIPIIGPVLAPIAGATAFAAVMAFQRGGEVPGVGNEGVPSLLHPREMVLDSGLADVVRNAASNNSTGKGNGRHVTYAPVVHVPPGGSAKEFEKTLENHFSKFLRNEARRTGVRLS
jgi:hypothetical protein